MNQRSSRRSKKNNNTDFVSLNTGGHIARHAPNEEPQVQVPQKATGDIKPEVPQAGSAKASPNFKPVPVPAKPLTQEAEKKVIAENSTTVVDESKSEEAGE